MKVRALRAASALLCALLAVALLPGAPAAYGSAAWPSFRGSAANMAITCAQTPVRASETALLWSKQLGSGWGSAPSAPIIAEDSLVVMAGTQIYRLNLETGAVIAQGAMASSPSYGTVGPVYAEGMLIAPLDGGIIQAFDARTLESLWVYVDPLGGQALSPIVYSEGRVYTGFWLSETKTANYVCVSTQDEVPSSPSEAKAAVWTLSHAGGFYWAGAVVVGDALIVGSDNATAALEGTSALYALDKRTGAVISKLDLVGDQRSSIAFDQESSCVYLTTKGGWLYSAHVDAASGVLDDLQGRDYHGQSTSTPVVYKGRVYFGFSDKTVKVADASSLELVYEVSVRAYPQCSLLLSTAYEQSEGYVCLYATYNGPPGGISLIKAPYDCESAEGAELAEIYEAEGFAGYCISSVICADDGTLYYKNDSGNLLAVRRSDQVPADREEEGAVVAGGVPAAGADAKDSEGSEDPEGASAGHGPYDDPSEVRGEPASDTPEPAVPSPTQQEGGGALATSDAQTGEGGALAPASTWVWVAVGVLAALAFAGMAVWRLRADGRAAGGHDASGHDADEGGVRL